MTGGTRAQREMIDAITSAGEDWPLTLLYLTPNGANIKLKAGREGDRRQRQLTMAATYLLFLEENMDGDLHEVATEAADVAEQMRDDDQVGEVHRGDPFDDE